MKDHTFPDTPIVDPVSKWQPIPRHLEGWAEPKDISRTTSSPQPTDPRVSSRDERAGLVQCFDPQHGLAQADETEYDCMSVGELNFTTPEQMLRYVHPDRHEINMGFSFDHVNLGLDLRGGDQAIVGDYHFEDFKDSIVRWQALQNQGGWHASYFENHDQVSLALLSGTNGSLT